MIANRTMIRCVVLCAVLNPTPAESQTASFSRNCRLNSVQPNPDDCDANAVIDDCERPGLQFSRVSLDVPGASAVRASTALNRTSAVFSTNEFLFIVDQVTTHPENRPPLALPPAQTGEWVRKLVAADFTSDQHDDLVVIRERSIVLVASQGNGFVAPRLLDLSSTGAYFIDNAAIAGNAAHLYIVIATDEGIWSIESPFSGSPVARQGPRLTSAKLVAIDADGDGSAEVAATERGVTHILKTAGTGLSEVSSFPSASSELRAVDVDGDGDMDLLGKADDLHTSIYYVNSSGQFVAQTSSYRTDWRTTNYMFGMFRSQAGAWIPIYGDSFVWLGTPSQDLLAPRFDVDVNSTSIVADFNGDSIIDFASIVDEHIEVAIGHSVSNPTMTACDVDTFAPLTGGNNGRLTLTVRSKGLLGLTGAQLTGANSAPLDAVAFSSSASGRKATITFSLFGATPGPRKLQLKFGAMTRTLTAEFDVRSGVECRGLSFNMVGPGAVRTGREATISIFYTNPCNIDVENIAFWVDVPMNVTVVGTTPTAWPPSLGADPGGDVVVATETAQRVGALEPLVPPGGTGTFSIKIKPQMEGDVHVSLSHSELTDSIGTPFVPNASVGADSEFGSVADVASLKDGEAIGKCMAAVGEHMAKKVGEGVIQGLQETYPGECVAGFTGHVYKVARYGWKAAHQELADGGASQVALADIGLDLAKASLKCAKYVGKNYPIVKFGNIALKAASMAFDGYKLWNSCKGNAGSIQGLLEAVGSRDPNDIQGPENDCKEGILSGMHAFMVRFENAASATAAARIVKIELQLTNVEVSGLRFGAIGLGGSTFALSGLGEQQRLLDLRPWVSQTVAFNTEKVGGQFTIFFSSFDLDSLTVDSDPSSGFLAPNSAPPDGEGFVIFTAANVEGATDVAATARITFDDNVPISTNRWVAKVVAPESCSAVNSDPPPGESDDSKDDGGCCSAAGRHNARGSLSGFIALLLVGWVTLRKSRSRMKIVDRIRSS